MALTAPHAQKRDTTEAGASSRGSALKAEVRGMSFAAGEAALSPADPSELETPLPGNYTPGVGEANARASLGEAADKSAAACAAAPKAGAKGDFSAAYEQLKAETMAKIGDKNDERGVEVTGNLTADYEAAKAAFEAQKGAGEAAADGKHKKGKSKAPKDPGSLDAFIRARWFDAYWHFKCLDFAAAIVKSGAKKGEKTVALRTMVRHATEAAAEGDEAVAKMPGRSTTHAGKTMQQLADAEAASPTMAPGAVVHLKLHWQRPAPYDPESDFHHWIVYDGGGLFTDSFSRHKPASAFDPFLQRFVKNHFGEGKFGGHRKETLPDGVTPRFVDKVGAKHPKAGLQPLVSAVYDPKAAAAAKG